MREDFLRVRVDGQTRREARNIFEHLGITEGDAVMMFLSQVCLHRKIPFIVTMGDKYKGVPMITDKETMRFMESVTAKVDEESL